MSKNYCCMDCGGLISASTIYRSGLCKKCCRKGKLNANFNNHKLLGKNNPSYKDGRCLKNKKCVDCSKLIDYRSTRCQRHAQLYYSKYHKTHLNITGKYNNFWMRSSWEIKFAKWLDFSRIKWIYEYKIFDLKNTTYTPDFYLPEFDCYVEIKGYWWKDAFKKYKKFKRKYPKVNIKIFDYNKLRNMSIL